MTPRRPIGVRRVKGVLEECPVCLRLVAWESYMATRCMDACLYSRPY
jgi:hypothetical protein